MNLLLKISLLVSTLGGCAASLQAQSREQHEITSILQLQRAAWNNGNLDSFMLYYWHSPELRFVSKKGVRKGWQEVYDNYKKSYAGKEQMGVLDFAIKSVDLINPSNAMVIGSWKVSNNSGIHEGYFTLWLKKINKQWVIVVDHTS